MADSVQQLVFKIVIDGKEVPVTLDVVKGQFVEAGAAADKVNEQIKKVSKEAIPSLADKPILKQFAQDLLQVEATAEEAAAGIAEFIKYNQLNEAEIEAVIGALSQQQSTLGITTTAYKSHQAAITSLNSVYAQMRGQQSGFAAGNNVIGQSTKLAKSDTAAMTQALGQFGFALGDADMFMMNFQMGMRSVANNIPMVVQGFIYARTEADRLSTTLGRQLVSSLSGAGGLLVGVNALMFLLNVMPALFSSNSDEAKNLDTKLDELTKTSNSLSDGFRNIKKEISGLSFKELSEKYDELILSILESEGKLGESSIWSKIWQGLTFKPVTSALGYSFSWQDAFEGPSSDDKNRLELQKKSKLEIEDTANKIKNFINAGYTAESLLTVAPADRKEISSYLGQQLDDWAESIDKKSLRIGDALKGHSVELGRYSREEIKKLKDTIEAVDPNKKTKDKDDTGSLANELKKTEELQGKLAEINVLKNISLSQYEKESQALRINYEAKIKGIDAEIAALEKKKKLDASDQQKIANLKTERGVAGGEFEINDRLLKEKHDKEMLQAEMDFNIAKMQLEKFSESEILKSKKDFYEKLLALENQPEERIKIQRQINLLETQIAESQVKEQLDINDAKIAAMQDGYEKRKAELLQNYNEQRALHKNQADLLALDDAKYKKASEDLEWQHSVDLRKVEIESINNQFEQKRNAADLEYELMKKKYGDLESLRRSHQLIIQQIDREELQNKIAIVGQVLGEVQNAYNQFYNLAKEEVRSDVQTWKTGEEEKIEAQRKAALQHATTQAQKDKINEQFDNKKKALDKEADKREQDRLEAWFVFQKALAIAQIGVQMAQAIAKGYGELGPIGGAIAMGITIAALTAQMVAVAAQKFPKGFATGGRLPKGKAGIFEGTHDEIVAPEEDFKSIFKTYSADLVKNALVDYKNYVSINGGVSGSDLTHIKNELTGLKDTVNKLNKVLENGIDARAVVSDRAAKEITAKGQAQIKKARG